MKALAARMTDLNAIDELAALDGSRPLEQIADWNPMGWGGAAYQMSPDQAKLIIAEYNKSSKQYKKAFDLVLAGKFR